MRCKVGDIAEVIGGALGLQNLGKIVEVCSYQGEHSQYGAIWRCRSLEGALITEYGAVGLSADFADDWLRPFVPAKDNQAALMAHFSET